MTRGAPCCDAPDSGCGQLDTFGAKALGVFVSAMSPAVRARDLTAAAVPNDSTARRLIAAMVRHRMILPVGRGSAMRYTRAIPVGASS